MTAPGQVLLAPPTRGEYLRARFEVQNAPAEAIAERTGTGIEGDMYPQIPAGAGDRSPAGRRQALVRR
jgi:hypothetical protein